MDTEVCRSCGGYGEVLSVYGDELKEFLEICGRCLGIGHSRQTLRPKPNSAVAAFAMFKAIEAIERPTHEANRETNKGQKI